MTFRERWRAHHGWLSFAIITAFLMAIIWSLAIGHLCSPIDTSDYKKAASCADYLLNRYQTFLGALIAIALAALAAFYVQQQINTARQIEADKTQRRHAATRFLLPLVLSELSEYATQSAHALRKVLKQCRGGLLDSGAAIPEMPKLPMEQVKHLSDFIEAADPQDIPTISDLIIDLQVQHSRIRSIESDLGRRTMVAQLSIETFIINTAVIFARIDDLFAFARREGVIGPFNPNRETITTKLHVLGFWESEEADLFKLVGRRYPS